MFTDRLKTNNPELIKASLSLFHEGKILPDTYVLDYDAIMENGKQMKKVADENGVKLFYMLKQIGRNPIIAKGLDEIGFDGCVAVDFKEALLMKEYNCKLAHVGHLVQIPTNAIKPLLKAKPQYITVYSYEMIERINDTCKELNQKQKIVLRIVDEDSDIYAGQVGGFASNKLKELVSKIEKLENIIIGGLTVFPALLYNADEVKIMPTKNMKAMNRAKQIMAELGYNDLMINMPSCTCSNAIPIIKEAGGNCGEPGHGLTGTTPLHKTTNQVEKVGYLYLTEVSHNFKNSGYCYGGGHYRRSHVEKAFVGDELKEVKVIMPDVESIDYHFELDVTQKIGEPVIMCFRTQVFTTRSSIAVVKGINTGKPELLGLFNGIGEPIKNNWSE